MRHGAPWSYWQKHFLDTVKRIRSSLNQAVFTSDLRRWAVQVTQKPEFMPCIHSAKRRQAFYKTRPTGPKSKMTRRIRMTRRIKMTRILVLALGPGTPSAGKIGQDSPFLPLHSDLILLKGLQAPSLNKSYHYLIAVGDIKTCLICR